MEAFCVFLSVSVRRVDADRDRTGRGADERVVCSGRETWVAGARYKLQPYG